MIKILFVCHGNICRSVGAQYILQDMVDRAGIAGDFLIDSAATSREEIGDPIYPPMADELRRRHIPLGHHRARQIVKKDYAEYDHIIGMDEENMFYMRRTFGGDPEHKVSYLMAFTDTPDAIIDDPWYTREFAKCADEITYGCEGLLAHLTEAQNQPFVLDDRLKQQLDFILEIDKEKNVFRQTHLSGHGRREDDAEHAWHMAVMAYLLQEYANEPVDISRVMIMCLIHDVVEIDAGDTYAYDEAAKKTQQARESAAEHRIYALLPDDQRNDLAAIFDEFEANETPEARFAHAMDNLQPLLLNNSNGGGDWKAHGVTPKQIYGRQTKTKLGSEKLYALTDAIIQNNIAKGNLQEKPQKKTTAGIKEPALTGIKVLDFTQVYSGPYCTMMLADFGADVIKVESPKGDQSRQFAPMKDGVSGYFNYLGRNKRSVTLNLKNPDGRQAALELAEKADVVIENFSAGTIDRLGLGYDAVKKRNPDVVYASISGFGQTGPYKDRLAYDSIAEAMGGLTSLSGPPEKAVKVTPAISDAITGIHTAYAIMAALFHREHTGEGQFIDMSMMDCVFSMLEFGVVEETLLGKAPKRLGNATETAVPYDKYPCKDGEIVLACANDATFDKFCRVMDREDLTRDPRFENNQLRLAHRDEIDAIIRDWFAGRTKKEIMDACIAARVPAAPVMSVADLLDDPQIAARGMLVTMDDPTHGKVRYPGNPIKLSETPAQFNRRAPRLGENNEDILHNVLGYSEEKIAQMRKSGAIG